MSRTPIPRAGIKSPKDTDLDRGVLIFDKLINEHGCDPFAIMARIAMGDVVGLDLMTADELAKPAKEFTFGEKRIFIPSGRHKAIDLIPPMARFLAAKELAQYCKPKLAATTFLDKEGKTITPQLVFYTPDNGRNGGGE